MKPCFLCLNSPSLIVQMSLMLLISSIVFGSVVPPAFADTPTSKRYQTSIPYTPSQYGQILVQVKLNGCQTSTFALDTGCSVSLVTDALVAKMRYASIPAIGSDGQPILFFPSKPTQMVTIPLLQMSNFRILNSPYVVVSQDLLTSLAGQPIDGILGAGTLTIYPMYFDFSKHRITLFSPSPTTAELAGVGMADAVAVPITDLTTNNGFEFASPVDMVNGSDRVQQNILIDTGGKTTTISEDTAQRLHLHPVSGDITSPTLFGNIARKRAYLPTLYIGGLSVNNLPLLYTRDITKSFGTHLGLDVLTQFRVLLDFKQQIMYLKPIVPIIPSNPARGLSETKGRDKMP